MAVNKNFVVKNGLEVSTDLIIANADTNKVGIATTAPEYTLHVNGGIGVTDSIVSGISTVVENFHVGTGGTIFSVDAITGIGSVGVGTASPHIYLTFVHQFLLVKRHFMFMVTCVSLVILILMMLFLMMQRFKI